MPKEIFNCAFSQFLYFPVIKFTKIYCLVRTFAISTASLNKCLQYVFPNLHVAEFYRLMCLLFLDSIVCNYLFGSYLYETSSGCLCEALVKYSFEDIFDLMI